VEKVERDPDRDGLIEIIVKPAAHLERLDEVLVITSVQPRFSAQEEQDLAASDAEKNEVPTAIKDQMKASEIMAEKLPGLIDPNLPPEQQPLPSRNIGSFAKHANCSFPVFRFLHQDPAGNIGDHGVLGEPQIAGPRGHDRTFARSFSRQQPRLQPRILDRAGLAGSFSADDKVERQSCDRGDFAARIGWQRAGQPPIGLINKAPQFLAKSVVPERGALRSRGSWPGSSRRLRRTWAHQNPSQDCNSSPNGQRQRRHPNAHKKDVSVGISERGDDRNHGFKEEEQQDQAEDSWQAHDDRNLATQLLLNRMLNV